MRVLAVALVALVALIPWVFEQTTFWYYLNGPPVTYFAYSGTRMPFFIMIEVALGAQVGFSISETKFVPFAFVGIMAVLLFTLLAYQICDPRQCYYPGPDRLGEIRFFVVLATGFLTGSVIGSIRYHINPRQETSYSSGKYPKLNYLFPFFWAVPVFVGYYASAILYNIPSEPPFSATLFVCYMAVSFLLTGFALSLFLGTTKRKTIALCVCAEIALFLLFRNWAALTEANDFQSAVFQLALGIMGAAVMAAFGHFIGGRLARGIALNQRSSSSRRKLVLLSKREYSLLAMSVTIVIAFWLFDSHPGVYAPVDMLPRRIQSNNNAYAHLNMISGAPDPMYYSGTYNQEPYFPTKRVEVTVYLNSTNSSAAVTDSHLLLVGMGAQSPNCCKDGLDYGYRADIARINDGQYYLVARAWETCDQNAGCSGFPWQSTMHETETPLVLQGQARISLAMAWTNQSGKSVHWYYRLSDSANNWTEFSSFVPQQIENPYFNLGVALVGNYATNFPSGNANFFQVGMAMSKNIALTAGNTIAFQCPAYYKLAQDETAKKYCFQDMQIINDGDSHWKVLWQWGISKSVSKIEVDNENRSVEILK